MAITVTDVIQIENQSSSLSSQANAILVKANAGFTSQKEGKQLALKYDMEFMEISVKENKGVDESFEKLINKISKNYVDEKKFHNLEIMEEGVNKKCLNCTIS